MEKKEILNKLMEIAEKLGIKILHENKLIVNGICKSYGKDYIILNKNLAVDDKIAICVECLKRRSLDGIYVLPEIREILSDD
ncbi:MAG TPA: hypothetical protein ENK92_00740 [Bacteroidetes bacterium]|uniref:Uncharacterized protein n=1 Tax=candidate division TA06 bacterium TaxID=2250710 RepID=A0A660S5K7_UNCT6|nr:MAG: hypothetical protein DRP44_07465 [candidate division TA06 bacterium]HHD82616.1 hypothetical protein [Bacteroidota bacterium]